MKGKIPKILRVGLALALVLSLGLVMAAPVAADSPTDTDVGFQFGEGASDTVEWSDAQALAVGAMGNYSVYLANVDGVGDTYVEFFPPSGITFADFEADIASDGDKWGFWNYAETTGGLAHGAQVELKFTDTASSDFFDINFSQHNIIGDETWLEVIVDKDVVEFQYWGPVLTNTVELLNFADLLAYENAGSDNLNADKWEPYQLTRVRVELYEASTAGWAYIDDITIDGTLYELEPIFLDAEYYSVGDTVEVTVPNFNANTDPIRINPVTGEPEDTPTNSWSVSVTSDSDSFGTTVDLEETGANTGVFTCSFTTVGTLPAAEDEIYVQDGDTITVTYNTYADWGAGTQSTALTAKVDDTVPTITGLTPADDAMTVETTPTISADYNDATAGIDTTSVEMFLDGVDVDVTGGASSVSYTPTEDLAEGSHDVTVNVSDLAGNAATESWSFRIVSWLAGPVEGTVLDGACLDALDTVGVEVCIFGDNDAYVTVGRYASNPEPDAPPTFTTIEDGFFDVKVTGADTATLIVIKFADDNITAESTAYVWGELEGEWLECSDQGYNPTDEFLWVKVRDDTTPNIVELGGTPFAISGVEVWDPMVYDVDGSGVIEKDEALTAVADYFDLEITKDQVLEVIALYFG